MAAGCVSSNKGFQTFVMTGDMIIETSFDPFKPKHQIPRDEPEEPEHIYSRSTSVPSTKIDSSRLAPVTEETPVAGSLPTSPQDRTEFIPGFVRITGEESGTGKRKIEVNIHGSLKHIKTDEHGYNEGEGSENEEIMESARNEESSYNEEASETSDDSEESGGSIDATSTARSLPRVNQTSHRVDYEFFNVPIGSALRKYLDVTNNNTDITEQVHEEQLQHFVNVFLRQNTNYLEKNDVKSEESCYLLVRALSQSMGNHNTLRLKDVPRNRLRMFSHRLYRANDGEDFNMDFLSVCFHDANPEFSNYGGDESIHSDYQKEGDNSIIESKTSTITQNGPVLTRSDYYCEGHVLRKFYKSHTGRKVTYGKRGWKKVFTSLKGRILYQESSMAQTSLKDTSTNSCIHLTNAAAHVFQHRKYRHTFRLVFADQSEHRFAVKSEKELIDWVSALNILAAFCTEPSDCQLYVHSATRGDLEYLINHHSSLAAAISQDIKSLQSSKQNKTDKISLRHKQTDMERHELYVTTLRSKINRVETNPKIILQSSEPQNTETVKSTDSKLLNSNGLLIQGNRLSYKLAVYKDEALHFTVDTDF